MKVCEISTTSEDYDFISTVSPKVTKSQYHILKLKNKTYLLEPYIEFSPLTKNKKEVQFKLGSELFKLLSFYNNNESNDEEEEEYYYEKEEIIICENGSFDNLQILDATDVYVYIKQAFDVENYFRSLVYVADHYKNSSFTILNISSEEKIQKQTKEQSKEIFYKITEKTKIYFTNIKEDFKVIGYEKYENQIKEMVYSTLFCKEELELNKFKLNNMLICKSKKSIKTKEMLKSLAKSLKANLIHLDFSSKNNKKEVGSNMGRVMMKSLSSLNIEQKRVICVFENSFGDFVSNFYGISEFLLQNEDFVFIFITNTDEETEKIKNNIEGLNNGTSNTVEIIQMEIPTIEDSKFMKIFLDNYQNDIKDWEVRQLFKKCKDYKINEMENIMRDVISRKLYQLSMGKKKKEEFIQYTISFKDIDNILNERKMLTSKKENKGFLKRMLMKLFIKKTNSGI